MGLHPELARELLLHQLLTFHIAELAAQLARQAGEEVRRPLSTEQLRRAWDAHVEELSDVQPWIFDQLERHLKSDEA